MPNLPRFIPPSNNIANDTPSWKELTPISGVIYRLNRMEQNMQNNPSIVFSNIFHDLSGTPPVWIPATKTYKQAKIDITNGTNKVNFAAQFNLELKAGKIFEISCLTSWSQIQKAAGTYAQPHILDISNYGLSYFDLSGSFYGTNTNLTSKQLTAIFFRVINMMPLGQAGDPFNINALSIIMPAYAGPSNPISGNIISVIPGKNYHVQYYG